MPRKIAFGIAGLIFALLLAMQAASSVASRSNPALALTLLPSNGLAHQTLLRGALTQGITDPSELGERSKQLDPLTRKAFVADPLGAASLAATALRGDTVEARAGIFAITNEINQRDLLLQGLVLRNRLALRDYDGIFATIDRILRVHPEQSETVFASLAEAFQDERAIPALVRTLDGSAAWHASLLGQAVIDPANAQTLAKMREFDGPYTADFDRTLIGMLVRTGDLEKASALYAKLTGTNESIAGAGTLDWSTRLAPFDWQLKDEPGLRAQLSRSQDALEIFVRAGLGGVVAQRLISPGADGFVVSVDHSLGPPDQIRDARLQLKCLGAGEPFVDTRFAAGTISARVDQIPDACAGVVELAIYARAWSGGSPLSGEITSVRIAPLTPASQVD